MRLDRSVSPVGHASSQACRIHPVEIPLARETFEGVGASIVEANDGAGDEMFHRAGDQHVAGWRSAHDARSDMAGDAPDIIAEQLACPGWRPARISSPNERTQSRTAWAQRMARAGPSNVARNPSFVGLISCPRKLASSRPTTA